MADFNIFEILPDSVEKDEQVKMTMNKMLKNESIKNSMVRLNLLEKLPEDADLSVIIPYLNNMADTINNIIRRVQ